ncbi:uncharacterized protein LOC132543112 [Ylistrum balloti]|uniref:uncharacterized protein LOC132543112 n=1 Tax=Ylistrum balloti TaxID=509963 RepID=UPI00290590DE|nr:uncharacterized protein LOC132543112 [Ylistrum balloti]
MATREEEDEEKQGAAASHQPHSTTDGLISSCFPAILGQKKCSSAVDDDGEVYSKAKTESETTKGQMSCDKYPVETGKQHQGGSQVNVTVESSKQHQGGSQATVTAQLAHQQGGDHKVNEEDDEDDDDCLYPVNQDCPGVAVLIGHSVFDTGEKERKGASIDLRNSYEIFQRLGFKIEYFWDEEVVLLQHKLKELAMSEKLKKADCFVCVVSTHGSEQEVAKGDRNPHLPSNIKVYEHFLSMKNGVMKTRDLLAIFDDSHCCSLRGKPRLFFIQACRSRTGKSLIESMDQGIQVDIVGPMLRSLPSNTRDFMSGTKTTLDNQDLHGSQPQSHQGSQSQIDSRGAMPPVIEREGVKYYEHTPPFPLFEDIVEMVPPLCPNNFLVMFATPSEMVAWSEDTEGGWLLSALYLEFIKHIRKQKCISVLPILTDISRRVAFNNASNMQGTAYHGMKSVPCLEHKLTGDVRLTPMKTT